MESLSTSTSFPLEANKLPRLHIDRESVNWWKQQARLEITALLQDRESWYYKGRDADTVCTLRSVYSSFGVRGYAESSQVPKRSAYFGEGVLNVTLEDVAYALYCDNSADQRTLATNVYRVNFLDGAVLDVFERKTPDDPFRFAGTKWVAYTIPPGLVKPQELIYFEFSCKTRDVDGHVVLVQYIMSPSLVPEQLTHAAAADLARAHMSQITTFRLVDDGTHCQTAGSFETSRSVPEWVAAKSLHQLFDNVARLVGLADARAIAALGTANAQSAARACYLCSKKFGVLHKRRNCRACGQSICAKCTIKLKVLDSVALPERPSVTQPSKPNSALKFVDDTYCLPCVLQARKQRPGSVSFSDTSYSHSLNDDEDDHWSATTPSSSDDRCSDIDMDMDLLDLHDALSALRSRRTAARFVEAGLSRADAVAQHKQQRHTIKRHVSRRAASNPVESSSNSRYRERDDARERVMRSVPIDRAAASQPPPHMPLQNVESLSEAVAPVQQERLPPPPLMPPLFDQLTQSIAAQEALLHSIQYERQRFHSQQQQQQQRWRQQQRRQSLDLQDDDNDTIDARQRFEVISDLDCDLKHAGPTAVATTAAKQL